MVISLFRFLKMTKIAVRKEVKKKKFEIKKELKRQRSTRIDLVEKYLKIIV